MTVASPGRWRPLFRSLMREARALPDETTRQYFRLKIKTDFRKTSLPVEKHAKLLRRLRAANAGYLTAIKRCMDHAFARRGKTAQLRLQSILSEARKGDMPPLIPGVPKSRLPNYTPLLTAYLTSPAAITSGKTPTVANLISPPRLPARADPASEEARLLGPFSKRRRVNIHWRNLRQYRNRLAVPFLPNEVETLTKLAKTATVLSTKREAIAAKALDKIPVARRLAYKERPKRFTVRFMRRRYAEILAKGVEVEQKELKDGSAHYTVRKPDAASLTKGRFQATADEAEWLL